MPLLTRNGRDARLRVVPIANHDGVVQLLLASPLIPELPRRHRPPPAGLPPDTHDLGLEPHEPVQIETRRERLQVPEHLLVAGEPARVRGAGPRIGDEGEVEEAHDLAWQVGAERGVEAGVRGRGAERVGGRRRGRVEPGPPHGGGALEDDGRVALAAQLARRRQARRARADDGEAEGGRRHCDVAGNHPGEAERSRGRDVWHWDVPGFFFSFCLWLVVAAAAGAHLCLAVSDFWTSSPCQCGRWRLGVGGKRAGNWEAAAALIEMERARPITQYSVWAVQSALSFVVSWELGGSRRARRNGMGQAHNHSGQFGPVQSALSFLCRQALVRQCAHHLVPHCPSMKSKSQQDQPTQKAGINLQRHKHSPLRKACRKEKGRKRRHPRRAWL